MKPPQNDTKSHATYDPERYWDDKARTAADPGAAVRLGDPLLDRCIERSQRALIESAMRELRSQSVNSREMSVLDFGCGTGQWTELLHSQFKDYVGVDISNAMLDSARASYPPDRFPNIQFHQVRDQTIPQQDNQVDVAFSLAVLHHNGYDEQAKLLSELRRVLKDGGWLFVLEGVGERNSDAKSNSYYRPIDDWLRFFQQHGLQLVWKSNCRYALLWYLCERIGARLPNATRADSRSAIGRALRRSVLRADAMLSSVLLPWTPNRLAGRCAMLLQLAKSN